MKKQTSHKLSIKRWVILTLIFGFVATAGAVIIDIDYSMRQLKNETAAQYLSILNMQRESLDTDIGKASAILLSYKMSGKHINQLINCKDKNEAYFAVTNVTSDLESQILNSTISEIVYAYKFGFDRFGIALSSTSHISSTEKLAVKDYVESLERETAGTTYMWKPCLIGDEWYFVYNIADRDYVIGQGIRVKTIASLFQMKLDENSSIAVLNDQEENMIDSVVARNNNQFLKNYTERYSSYNIYEDQIIVYTYSLNLYRPIFFIKDGLLSQNFLNIVRLLWSTVFFIIIICFIIFNNITFAILRPVKALNKCLESIRDGNLKAKIPINSSVPREFSDVYNTLNEMTSRIQELKIESYESELKRTHYELQFLSIQIEPHFYLNSMKYIYALAQTKQYETLKSMILNLADCFRYLTYDNEKMVPLQKELEHVEHYLTITNSGSPSCVKIFLSVHPHAKEALVPKRACQLLDLLYYDVDLNNLLSWGIEGVHYIKTDDPNIIEYPEGIDASTVSYYSWGKWELPNNYLQYVMAPSPSNLWEEMDEFNMAAAPSKALGFVFDTTPVEGEITAVQNVITQYDPGLGSGTLEPSKLEEFQQALLDNGVQKIIDEAQRQLDEFISNKQ